MHHPRVFCAGLLLLALTAPAGAQSFEGLYRAVGTDAALGPYTGRVQLIDVGTHYSAVREVTYQNPAPSGRTITTVWIGAAVAQGNVLHVSFPIERMDWITQVGGLQRTTADQVPDTVTGTYRPDPSGGLAVTLASVGGISASEAVTRTGAAGAPLHIDDRTLVPMHSAPPSWLKRLVFAIFSDYHRIPEIAAYSSRPEFQAAVHYYVQDRRGFDWLRAHPNQLFVMNKTVDAISLAEAEMRHSAYGRRLFEKAALYQGDVDSGRHLDEGLLAFGVQPNPAAPGGVDKFADMSTFLWSAVYLYGQAARYQVTGDPSALALVESLATRFCDMIEIDPIPGEFARSLRPVNRAPNTGRWHAGSGQFSHLAYYDNGNNDMIKGLWLAFLGAWDVLPQNHPLRPRMIRCVREIADHWASANPSAAGGTGHRRDSPKNTMLNAMLAYWMTGDPTYEATYQRALREPRMLLELATGGTFALYGIGDWSGSHLGITSYIAMIELGRRLNLPWVPVFEHGLRTGYSFMHDYRQTVWSVAAASLLGHQGAADETLWHLRGFPYPKTSHTIERQLDRNWSFSPYPSLPWKLDWMTSPGRRQGINSYPVFMRPADNYVYRSGIYDQGGTALQFEFGGGDYMFVYWMARKYGVIAPGE